MKAIIIAAASSGSGKTTFTSGLLNYLRQRAVPTAAFKAGPDFIDPQFHKRVLGRASYNLDTRMMTEETVKSLFLQHTADVEYAVIEGVMGLFDGYGDALAGSTADLARILELPVLLLINCRGMSQTAAAIIAGCKAFDPRIKIAGVILNNSASESHYQMLAGYIEKTTGVPCYGMLPTDERLHLGSRHLGLIQAGETDGLDEIVNRITETMAKYCRLDAIFADLAEYKTGRMETDEGSITTRGSTMPDGGGVEPGKPLVIGIARDPAFTFYYEDNLEQMQERGITLVPFSPMYDRSLPEGLDGLYIGGGYPELYAAILAANTTLKNDIKERAMDGLPIYAECGGLLYLSDTLVTHEGTCYPMVGIFNCQGRMTERLNRFGYIELTVGGETYRAHEFHYSTLAETGTPDYKYVYAIRKGTRSWQCGLLKNHVLAGYPHLHFAGAPGFLDKLVAFYRGNHVFTAL